MSTQTNDIIKEINVDVYDRKVIIVNAKQYDSLARYILVTCYNQGSALLIDNSLQYAYTRMKKPDGKCVFNDCVITENGKVQIELTEQMLASGGNAIIELVILDKDNTADVTENTGELIIDNQKIFSTMTFYVNIVDSACNCWDIESSDEFNALNSLMIQATKNYNDVMTAAKASEEAALASEEAARASEEAAANSEQNALTYSNNAKVSENNAKASEDAAALSLIAAQESEHNASVSEQNANTAKEGAESAAALAESYANESESHANLASQKVEEAAEQVEQAKQQVELAMEQVQRANDEVEKAAEQVRLAESYAIGGTGLRENEDTDNAKYYTEQAQAVVEAVDETYQLAKSYAVGETGLREGEETDNAKYYYNELTKLDTFANAQWATEAEVKAYLGIEE